MSSPRLTLNAASMIKAILHMLGRLPAIAMLLPGLAYMMLSVGPIALSAVGNAGLHLDGVWEWITAGARSGLHWFAFCWSEKFYFWHFVASTFPGGHACA
jgi:hypothetical protein